jgi:trehalose-phosphatase
LARLVPLLASLDSIRSRLRRARSLAVASDFDGTLVAIARRPRDAVLPQRARAALRGLVGLRRCAVAVISGRSLDDLRGQVRLGGAFLAGATGFESIDPAGRRTTHVPRGRGLSTELRVVLADWCRRFPGTWVEDKGPTLALHYRALEAGRRRGFAAGVRRRLESARPAARQVRGLMVYEVMPAVRWDKAAVFTRWLAERPGALPVFLGDDTVDEPVHDAVRRRGGVSVAVGRRASRAEFGLADSTQVVWFLEWLAEEWRGAASPEYRPGARIRRQRRLVRDGRLQGRTP